MKKYITGKITILAGAILFSATIAFAATQNIISSDDSPTAEKTLHCPGMGHMQMMPISFDHMDSMAPDHANLAMGHG